MSVCSTCGMAMLSEWPHQHTPVRGPFPGWQLDPDPLTLDEPPPPDPAPRRLGCSVAVITLILALSGVPGVAGSTNFPSPRADIPAPSGPPSGSVGTVLLGGFATWYDTPGYTAAAGPALREVLGDWRGRYVTVEAGDRSVVVRLTDWCACGERHGRSTLLDLSRKAFAALADPARGVVRVSIEIDGSPRPDEADDRMRVEDGGPALPQTSTEDGYGLD